ncbi:MAG: pyridoxamine 5'-phosphate oxidase family protein [Erysipelotrichaceae bacterium]|nr:pyridoxamine 5'-phosphate oxidase family protein [Erysipelotrichaceae bacterium]MBQ5444544.1 pyridoxamine 5'-phosphate oxidase family protein [Erysipelotrichaceae bacterium]MBQ6217146.1 pyridoxamine 5'-phosphate oxidase family protein [Erysipelotrichaceae bacterium]
MFRQIKRVKQALNKEECLEILKKEKRGVLSVLGDDDYPYGMPINHYYDEDTHKLYFHGGRYGHKIDAMRRHDKASFCVYGDGFIENDNWYLCFKSVIVFGRIEFIEDKKTIEDMCRKLSYHFTDNAEYIESEIAKDLNGTLMFSLSIEDMQGKYVTEK